MRRSIVALVTAAVVVAGTAVSAAWAGRIAAADGGLAISSAPEIQSGQTVSGSITRLDFWRLNFDTGDELTINYESLDKRTIGLCFMKPDVTDFTLVDAQCWEPADTDRTDTKRQTKRLIVTPGKWTLIVASYNCLFYNKANVKCGSIAQYSLTVYIRKSTQMRLRQPPRVLSSKKPFTIPGQVASTTPLTGNVALQKRAGARWVNVGLAKLKPNGAFVAKFAPGGKGTLRFRVYYPGDQNHRVSSAAFQVTAV